MLRDNLVSGAGPHPLAPRTNRKQSSDDRPACLENPRPAGAESTLTENVASPFHAEPGQSLKAFAGADYVANRINLKGGSVYCQWNAHRFAEASRRRPRPVACSGNLFTYILVSSVVHLLREFVGISSVFSVSNHVLYDRCKPDQRKMRKKGAKEILALRY